LIAPNSDATRPTTDRTRESLFNILESRIDFSGIRVLDLFAGTGALGLEAISRGAGHCCFVENARQACALIKRNVMAFELEGSTQIIRADCTNLAPLTEFENFDLAFADPPYGKNLGHQASSSLVKFKLLKSGGLLVLEESKDHAPVFLERFELEDQRSYGTTSICFFRSVGV